MSDLQDGENEDGNVDEQMGQHTTEEELGVVDGAHGALDRAVPESRDGPAVKDGEERL